VDDTPFVNDGADTSLRKAVSLLNKIEAKTGSGSASGTVALDATSLAALENISVTFPATQNVNVTNAGLNVSVTNLPATQPVSGSVSVSNFPATQPVSGTFWPTTQPISGSVSLIELIPQDSALELIVSADNFGGSYLKSQSSYYQGSSDNALFWQSGSSRWEFRGDNNYLWTYNNSANQSAAYIPKTGWVMGDNPYFKGVEIYARKDIDLVKDVSGLGSGQEAAASGDQTGTSIVAILKRGLVHLSSIIAKLPNLISNRIPVDGSGVTQPVSGTFWPATQPVSGTVSVSNLPATQPISGSISVSNFPATQPVSGTFWPTTQPVSGSVSVTNLPATQPVSIANPPVTPVTDNGGSLTVDGSITATQATAASLKAQAQLLNAAGSVVDYAMTGTAGTPATDVVTVQGISGGTVIPVSLASVPSHAVTGPLTNTELRATSVPVSLASVPSHPVTGPLTNTELRAAAVPISGTVTANTGLTPLTDTQLRASAVSVSLASVPSHPVTGPLTDTQLRAAAVAVSLATAPTTPVTDNGGSLTVDGTITSRLADGAGNNLTSVARGSERALSVQIVDASGAQVTTVGGGGGGGGTVTATQTTPSALKAQAQILDATGSQMSFVNAGVAGTPSVDVLTVQGSTSGTPIPVRVAAYSGGSSVTFSNFTSTTSSAFAGVDSNRKVLTIFNEGSGFLYIKPAAYSGDVVSTTNYQIRMSPGDYWEVPNAQLGLQHLGIFNSAGTARITSIS